MIFSIRPYRYIKKYLFLIINISFFSGKNSFIFMNIKKLIHTLIDKRLIIVLFNLQSKIIFLSNKLDYSFSIPFTGFLVSVFDLGRVRIDLFRILTALVLF